jgi:glycosyltransferase involved in cell wall biosynthesis
MAQNLTARRALHTVESKLVGRIDSAFSEQIDHPIVAKPIDSIPQRIGRNLILDVSDLVFYIGHHANLTGIQRVQACLILALFRVGDNPSIRCLSWDRVNSRFIKLSNSYFVRLLKDITRPEPDRTIQFDVKAARDGILPEAELFHALPDDAEDNTFVLLGAAWVNPDYFYQITKFKRQLRAKFVCVVHDLIPIYARETCDQGTAEVFRVFLEQAYRLADLFVCVSENTRKDLERFASSEGLRPPEACVITHATEFRDVADIVEFRPNGSGASHSYMLPERFVLFVSTIEGRKNHRLAFNIWRKLLSTYGEDTPVLVCVGRFGWRSEDFIRDVVATNNLCGKIIIKSDVSDEELDELYDSCMFTIYPSLYEGWGLPISESLGKGKLCVCSNTSSMPEAGQEFALYIDPTDPAAAFETVKGLIEDRSRLASLNLHIRQGFVPKSWTQAAEEYLDVLSELSSQPAKAPYVKIISGREYLVRSVPKGFGSLLGDELFWNIRSAYTGTLSLAGVSVGQFFDGQELRGKGAWKEPEAWGTWLGVDGGVLEFVWPEKRSASLLCAVAYRILPIFTSKDVIYTIGLKVQRLPALSNAQEEATHLIRCELVPGYNSIAIGMELTAEDRAKAASVDVRSPMIGISSIMLVDRKNLEERLDLYETLLQKRGIL